MAIELINLDLNNPEHIEQLKREWRILQVSTVACLSSGLVIWLASPFVIKGKDAPWLRYASLFSSLFCGSMAIVSVVRLEKIQPIYKAIEQAENQTFVHKTATSQWTIQKLFEREANIILRPTQPVPQSHSLSGSQSDSQPKQNDSQSDSQPFIEEHSQPANSDSQFAANEVARTLTEQPSDQRAERFELLRQLKKNRRTKAQMIERLWGVTEYSSEYSYYAEKLEEMLADLKRIDSES